MEVLRLGRESDALVEVLDLIRRAFTEMEGRIDPPSSMHSLDEGKLRDLALVGEVWGAGQPVRACMILTPRADHLYLGKLAVDARYRGQGLARRLCELAEDRARALGLGWVKLEVRVELTENHALFERMGFKKVAENAHAGYARPTSLTFAKSVECQSERPGSSKR